MYGFKILGLALCALLCTVVATESCASSVVVTVTVPECVTEPNNPTATLPGYSVPGTPVEPTETAKTSSLLPEQPSHPVSLPAPGIPLFSIPVAASSSAVMAPSSGIAHPSGSPALATALIPSSTATHNQSSAITSHLPVVSTAIAALATPVFGLGSFIGAAAAAVIVAV